VSSAVVVKSFVNSFHYLYEDASKLSELARNATGFERTQYCRTALLIYIISLEGLINRALDHFLPEKVRDYLLERERKLSIEDKWLALPLLSDPQNPRNIDKSVYPWSHFLELIQIRDDFVHPKHDRPAYYKLTTTSSFEPLNWKDLPPGLNVKERDVVYRQTRISRDPYSVMPEHLDMAKKVVDDTVEALDRLLGGKLTNGNWLRSDTMTVIHPQGATLQDVPPG
jgi:hypothetical protein